jgi:hypothetical protein
MAGVVLAPRSRVSVSCARQKLKVVVYEVERDGGYWVRFSRPEGRAGSGYFNRFAIAFTSSWCA